MKMSTLVTINYLEYEDEYSSYHKLPGVRRWVLQVPRSTWSMKMSTLGTINYLGYEDEYSRYQEVPGVWRWVLQVPWTTWWSILISVPLSFLPKWNLASDAGVRSFSSSSRFSCSTAAWTGNLLERTNLGWIPSILSLDTNIHRCHFLDSRYEYTLKHNFIVIFVLKFDLWFYFLCILYFINRIIFVRKRPSEESKPPKQYLKFNFHLCYGFQLNS